MKNTIENAERFIMELAYFMEAHPSDNPRTNQHYAQIRHNYFYNKGYVLKYGKCEICGEQGTLCEIGLSWCCNFNDKCKEEMTKQYS